MASREARRQKAKKGEAVSETIEKKRELHPFLYVFSVIVLVVIVVTFVGSPVAGRIGGGGSIVFGTYEGKEISYQPGNYFAQQLESFSERARQSGQTDDPAAQAQAIWYQAYQQAVLHTAILVETQKAGLQISEDKIDEALLSNPRYLDDNGKFSEELFRKIPMAERVQTRKLTRDQLLRYQFELDVFTGMKTGEREKSFLFSMVNTQRSFEFISFSFSSYPADEILKYAQANKPNFRKAKVSRIVIKSGEREAKEIGKKLADKTSSFEELAKTHSKDGYASVGGDMGWRYAYDLEGDFDKPEQVSEVFALKAGEVSGVLKGPFGWLIYRMDADPLEPDFSDPSTFNAAKDFVMKYQRGKVEDYFMEKAGKASRRAAEIGFPAAAKEAGAAVFKTDFFPINLQNVFIMTPLKGIPESATPASAPYSQEFFIRAFSLGKDAVSPPVVLDDQIVVLKLLAERQLPAATAAIMPDFQRYLANQSLQTDLQSQLMDPEKLKDNFAETFSREVFRTRRSN